MPQGFVGVNGDRPLLYTKVNIGAQLDKMVANGVESIRLVFNWAQAQPQPSFASISPASRSSFQNVDGVPTTFAFTDRLVQMAAERGFSVLPVVLYAPPWDTIPQSHPNYVQVPSQYGPPSNYANALVGRYAPHGSFWSQNPMVLRIPIRM